MRSQLLLAVALLATPLVGCLGGGEELEQTNTSEAEPEEPAPDEENPARSDQADAGNGTDEAETPADNATNGTDEPEPPAEPVPVEPPRTAVVGQIDAGINPYHEAFHDESELARTHPSEYIDGFPEDAEALNLTLDADSYEEALTADEDVWANVTRGELYWIPGTRIVGAISLDEGLTRGDREDTPILDDHGHGTMTASRAVGEGTSLAPDARIVTIEGFGGQEVRWAADQGWIDVQTNSWVDRVPPPANRAQDEAPLTDVESTSEAFAYAADRTVTFTSSGNGLAYQAGVAPQPTYAKPAGAPGVILVGAHDNGHVAAWSGAPPHVVADGFRPLVAAWDATEGIDAYGYACCTSASSPYAAGAAASLIAEARAQLGDASFGAEDGVLASGEAPIEEGPLADGDLTITEVRELVLTTAQQNPAPTTHDGDRHWGAQPADERPEDPTDPGDNRYCPGCVTSPVAYEDIPAEVPTYALAGYGAINVFSDQRATQVLLGVEEQPDREDADRFYGADQSVRGAYYAPGP